MSFDIDARTVFSTLTGSHAYGTARPGSDVDIRGCCVAPLRVRLSFRQHFEQFTWPPTGAAARGSGPGSGPVFAAALARAAAHPRAGPSLLFVDEREILHTTPV